MENKMKSIEKKDRTTDLIQALLDVWEKSVRATSDAAAGSGRAHYAGGDP